MDEIALNRLYGELGRGNIADALPSLIDLTRKYCREIPEQTSEDLDATGCDWRYYAIMSFYAIR